MMVSNPVDIAYERLALMKSGWHRARVIGRRSWTRRGFAMRFASGCDVDARNVHGYILGEHGDSEFAAWSLTSIAGQHIDDFCRLSCGCWSRQGCGASRGDNQGSARVRLPHHRVQGVYLLRSRAGNDQDSGCDLAERAIDPDCVREPRGRIWRQWGLHLGPLHSRPRRGGADYRGEPYHGGVQAVNRIGRTPCLGTCADINSSSRCMLDVIDEMQPYAEIMLPFLFE